ncbi:MAG TPA: MerR family transcriptional regulator [Thermomicrobiales bacterium]|jgi:DNA-binding transcriptional MerR regulator
MVGQLYKIGELAGLSGVSTKTIRFYSDIGALPPAQVTEAGYRLYDDADRSRLATIRALREIGLDLPTIIALLRDKVSVTEALSVQLDAIELTLRTARRQRALLKSALGRGEAAALTYLDQAQTLAKFDALERQEFLSSRMEQIFAGVNADATWKARFWEGAVLDLPDDLNEAQFTAWLELAELVSDEDFLRRLNEMGRESWNGPHEGADQAGATVALNDLYWQVAETLRVGETPTAEVGRQLIDTYLGLHARSMGRQPDDTTLPVDLLDMIDRNSDPRATRYWELIGIIKGWPPSPMMDAHRWLVRGVQERADRQANDAAEQR